MRFFCALITTLAVALGIVVPAYADTSPLSCQGAPGACVAAIQLDGHQAFAFDAAIPPVAFHGGRTPQVPYNPAAFVFCDGTQAAFVAPWVKVERLPSGDWYSSADQPPGGYLLPADGNCEIDLYYWTFDHKTPVAHSVASATFVVPA